MDVWNAKEWVRRLANTQFGRVSRDQLTRMGIGRGQIESWCAEGYLIRVLPRVFAVGHVAPSIPADLCAAALYAGPGAALSHGTAAWWLGLVDRQPPDITVSSPRRRRSLPGITVHGRRITERIWHRGLPTTTIEQAVVDLACDSDLRSVREALAELDYQRRLDVRALLAVCGSGRAGSTLLREALAHHEPRLARTRSRLEKNFLYFCERFELPLPEVNVWVHGVFVDAYWPAQRVVVELDGGGNHGTWAQIRRDRRNELTLRRHGVLTLRYTWGQVHDEPALVRADILTILNARA